jgi:hypothetical protein
LFQPAPSPRIKEASLGEKEASLGEGELFGEMSCLYLTLRQATVIADQDCYMVEMLRNILDRINRKKPFKEHLERIYR